MHTIVTVLSFVLGFLFVFSVIVVLHELGHYWMARALGAKVEVFSFGFGPRLFGFRAKTGVDWRFSAIPLGGYVKFEGDMDAASQPEAGLKQENSSSDKGPRLFAFLPLWRRAMIVAAGPGMNFILAIAVFATLAWSQGEDRVKPIIGVVIPDFAADKAGFKLGDHVLSINGRLLKSFSEFRQRILIGAGETLTIKVEREGEIITLQAVPERVRQKNAFGGSDEVGRLGLLSSAHVSVEHVHFGPAGALLFGINKTWDIIAMTGLYLKGLVVGRTDARQLGGPLRIATVSGMIAVKSMQGSPQSPPFIKRLQDTGLRLISLIALLSVGLGLVNLLPIPALDGGHLLFYMLEAIKGKPVGANVQKRAYHLGFFVLFSVFLFSTWNDVHYLQSFHS